MAFLAAILQLHPLSISIFLVGALFLPDTWTIMFFEVWVGLNTYGLLWSHTTVQTKKRGPQWVKTKLTGGPLGGRLACKEVHFESAM